jgi:hypothetical protein
MKHGARESQAMLGNASEREWSPRIGRLVAGSTPTSPIVDFDGNVDGPIPAQTTLTLNAAILDRAVASGQGAVIVFENGNRLRPILTGLIQAAVPPSPLQELLMAPRPLPTLTPAPAGEKNVVEARLDGHRVILEGKHEISLKCGDASITLRRDGKVIVRGAYVETHARGINRIKGGAVKIN